MRVLYYMEKELANFDPSRPGPLSGRVERGEKPYEFEGFQRGGGEACFPDYLSQGCLLQTLDIVPPSLLRPQ